MDKITLEQQEINNLLNNGVEFEIDGVKYLIKQPTLGVLHLLSFVFIKMKVDEEQIKTDPLGASRAMVLDHADLCAKVVAIAVLGNKCVQVIGSPSHFIFKRTRHGLIDRWAKYFLYKVTPEKLAALTMIINQMGNYGDFINSIRWMSAARVTAPSRVEDDEQA